LDDQWTAWPPSWSRSARASVLRLVTGSSVSENLDAGARAGRGPVELVLPDVPTVSRQHARFTFSAGRWWVAKPGYERAFCQRWSWSRGEQPLSDGDSIRWGTGRDAPRSLIEDWIEVRADVRECDWKWWQGDCFCGQLHAMSGWAARLTRSPGWTGAPSATNEGSDSARAPRCAGLRPTCSTAGNCSAVTRPIRFTWRQLQLGHRSALRLVRRAARHVLPTAAESYEARPVVLDQGLWVVKRGRLGAATAGSICRPEAGVDAAGPDGDQEAVTRANELMRRRASRRDQEGCGSSGTRLL